MRSLLREPCMTDTVAPEPTPEQAALLARVRRMMLIAGLTSALAVAVRPDRRRLPSLPRRGKPRGTTDGHYRSLPKGARIVSTGGRRRPAGGDLDIGGVTEIRTFDARTLKPAGKLKFVSEP